MEIVLHDRGDWRKSLLPLAWTRPVGAMRIGVLTLQEKWGRLFGVPVSCFTELYLQAKFLYPTQHATSYLIIKANVCPDEKLVKVLNSLPVGSILEKDGKWIAYHISTWVEDVDFSQLEKNDYKEEVDCIENLEDVFLKNAKQIYFDYALLTSERESEVLGSSNAILGTKLFIGKRVKAECCIFNTESGPIYIDDDAVIEEGSCLRGPIAIGKQARVKMGSKLYPNVSLGVYATIGGEANNAVLFDYASKGHDGYLGCAVLGEGCNFGAGTSNSNLQNNWKAIKLYDYKINRYRETGYRKIGTFVGDYAMCGINSSITTGSVIGVGAQVAISNIIPKFVADFCWWSQNKLSSYNWEKFVEMVNERAKIRGEGVDEKMWAIWKFVYTQTEENRTEFIGQTK